MKTHIPYIAAIIGLIVVILLLRSCDKTPPAQTITVTEYEYIHDTIKLPVSVPVLVYEEAANPDSVLIYVRDSAKCRELAENCLAKRTFTDTTDNDTITIITDAWVSGNRIDSLKHRYKWKLPTVINTTTILPANRVQVFIAGNMATTGTSFLAGPEVLVQDKKGFLYGGFAQFSTDNRHVYGVKIGWRLQFKTRPKIPVSSP